MVNIISNWLKVENGGEVVVDENNETVEDWVKGHITLRDGYRARRKALPENGTDPAAWQEIVCAINKSTQGHPLFRCEIGDWHITSTNPTTCMRKTLCKLNSAVKGKLNGYRFFGLQSKEYESLRWSSKE